MLHGGLLALLGLAFKYMLGLALKLGFECSIAAKFWFFLPLNNIFVIEHLE